VAVSVDSLRPEYHDRFRPRHDALADTHRAIRRMRDNRLDFIVQTRDPRQRARSASLLMWAAEQGAVSFNLYFLVPPAAAPAHRSRCREYESLLGTLAEYERRYRGTMMVRAKCAPHFIRKVYEESPDSSVLNYATRCPCGIQYCRITPRASSRRARTCEGRGDLTQQSFGEIWNGSTLSRTSGAASLAASAASASTG